jgi:hypothetical protein
MIRWELEKELINYRWDFRNLPAKFLYHESV